jgi:hypothetical protein
VAMATKAAAVFNAGSTQHVEPMPQLSA